MWQLPWRRSAIGMGHHQAHLSRCLSQALHVRVAHALYIAQGLRGRHHSCVATAWHAGLPLCCSGRGDAQSAELRRAQSGDPARAHRGWDVAGWLACSFHPLELRKCWPQAKQEATSHRSGSRAQGRAFCPISARGPHHHRRGKSPMCPGAGAQPKPLAVLDAYTGVSGNMTA